MVMINGKDFSEDEVQKMLDAGMSLGQKNDTFSSSYIPAPHARWGDTTTPGLFTTPGVEPDMVSAVQNPAYMSALAMFFRGTSGTLEEKYDIITAVDDPTGSNATSFCAEAPKIGLTRVCTQASYFGKYMIQTERGALPEIGGRLDTADVDRRVLNNFARYQFAPDILANPNINTHLGMQIYALSINVARAMERVLFEGSRANSGVSAETGFIQEFDGFDQLIKTGHVDLLNSTTCAAADSIVTDLNYANITAAATDIVEEITGIYYDLNNRAEESGWGMWDGVIAMEPDLFYALCRVWPSEYLTEGAVTLTTGNGDRLNVDASDARAERNRMLNGNYLMINGQRIPVLKSRGISRANSGPGFASDIYFIDRNTGGFFGTYVNGWNMNNVDVNEFLTTLGDSGIRVTNGGFYMVAKNRTGFCEEFLFAAKPRLVVRRPYLCARLTNVQYTLSRYSRSGYTDDPYYAGGGVYKGQGRYTASGGMS